MPPVAFLALLTIALMLFAALRLELNFRRAAEATPEPRSPRPEPRSSRPELRSAPAGGYCQSPWPVAALRKA
jgi:hypothetical protein